MNTAKVVGIIVTLLILISFFIFEFATYNVITATVIETKIIPAPIFGSPLKNVGFDIVSNAYTRKMTKEVFHEEYKLKRGDIDNITTIEGVSFNYKLVVTIYNTTNDILFDRIFMIDNGKPIHLESYVNETSARPEHSVIVSIKIYLMTLTLPEPYDDIGGRTIEKNQTVSVEGRRW